MYSWIQTHDQDEELCDKFYDMVCEKYDLYSTNSHLPLLCQKLDFFFDGVISLPDALKCLGDIICSQTMQTFDLDSIINIQTQAIRDEEVPRRLVDILQSLPKGRYWQHTNVLNLLLHLCLMNGDLHNGLYVLHHLCGLNLLFGVNAGNTNYFYHMNTFSMESSEYNPNSDNSLVSLFEQFSSLQNSKVIVANDVTLQYIHELFQLVDVRNAFSVQQSPSKSSVHIQPKTIEWSVQLWAWILAQYTHLQPPTSKQNVFLPLFSGLTQQILLLVAQDIATNLEYNAHLLCQLLHISFSRVPNFCPTRHLWGIVGKEIVGESIGVPQVLNKVKIVLDNIHKIFGSDHKPPHVFGAQIPPPAVLDYIEPKDLARLIGSVLHHFDENICKYLSELYSNEQGLYTLRYEMQKELAMKIHREYNISGLLKVKIDDEKLETN
ncbi:hypothetical protein RFI_15832 [Reticulomyxa filosa]|uniref:Uncharacterized protein n=1 Tax=Reticulomyxa filosa TaxID=46433 RepID=X6N647_RETFI|nr:hypothetical protein RFI_15832 [Reticulomyxa filosa]|eukprot:ETO21373.1 hypothetical protein RFI_15832 [Reticulomyxa filosa]